MVISSLSQQNNYYPLGIIITKRNSDYKILEILSHSLDLLGLNSF